MAFMDQINADIKSSMLAKEKEKLAVLRDIKSKLLLEATSGAGGEVTDEAAMQNRDETCTSSEWTHTNSIKRRDAMILRKMKSSKLKC